MRASLEVSSALGQLSKILSRAMVIVQPRASAIDAWRTKEPEIGTVSGSMRGNHGCSGIPLFPFLYCYRAH